MRYLLMMNHTPAEEAAAQHLSPEEMQASWKHMEEIWHELSNAGELIATGKLAGPEAAKIVMSDGLDAPVVTDGPFPEMKEFLAGFWMVDVESEERAIEIAARTSAAPGPGGRPSRYPIEVRAIMGGVDPEL